MAYQINGIFPGKLFPNETIAGCIDIFENVWPNPNETIALVEKESSISNSGFYWSPATTLGAGTKQDHRTNYHVGITYCAEEFDNSLAKDIHNQAYFLIQASLNTYAEKHNLRPLINEHFNMLRYSGGQHYKAHADGFSDTKRTVSAIIYLNDDFDGGEIEFINFGIKIKPKPGMLLLFPSNYAYSHIAHPVTNGTKYAIVTWLKDI